MGHQDWVRSVSFQPVVNDEGQKGWFPNFPPAPPITLGDPVSQTPFPTLLFVPFHSAYCRPPYSMVSELLLLLLLQSCSWQAAPRTATSGSGGRCL